MLSRSLIMARHWAREVLWVPSTSVKVAPSRQWHHVLNFGWRWPFVFQPRRLPHPKQNTFDKKTWTSWIKWSQRSTFKRSAIAFDIGKPIAPNFSIPSSHLFLERLHWRSMVVSVGSVLQQLRSREHYVSIILGTFITIGVTCKLASLWTKRFEPWIFSKFATSV